MFLHSCTTGPVPGRPIALACVAFAITGFCTRCCLTLLDLMSQLPIFGQFVDVGFLYALWRDLLGHNGSLDRSLEDCLYTPFCVTLFGTIFARLGLNYTRIRFLYALGRDFVWDFNKQLIPTPNSTLFLYALRRDLFGTPPPGGQRLAAQLVSISPLARPCLGHVRVEFTMDVWPFLYALRHDLILGPVVRPADPVGRRRVSIRPSA